MVRWPHTLGQNISAERFCVLKAVDLRDDLKEEKGHSERYQCNIEPQRWPRSFCKAPPNSAIKLQSIRGLMHSLVQSPQDLIVSGTLSDTHRCTPLNPVKLTMKINHQMYHISYLSRMQIETDKVERYLPRKGLSILNITWKISWEGGVYRVDNPSE